jgi:hypothetical protein
LNHRAQGVWTRRLQSARIRLAEDWKPNFALPVKAQDYVGQLKSRLRLILCVSEAQAAIAKARQRQAAQAEIERLKQDFIRMLPALPIDPLYRQDSSVVNQQNRTASFAEIIARL